MAELNFGSGRGGRAKKAVAVPTKQTINFIYQKKQIKPGRLAVLLVLAAIALLAIGKFGFLDQEMQRSDARNAVIEKQAELALINAKLADYDALAEQYGRYSYGWMSEAETSLVNRTEILELLDKEVLSVAQVEDFAINENILTMNISGATLARASQIVKNLENSPLVKTASVYSASSDYGQAAEIFMSVVLEKEAEEA